MGPRAFHLAQIPQGIVGVYLETLLGGLDVWTATYACLHSALAPIRERQACFGAYNSWICCACHPTTSVLKSLSRHILGSAQQLLPKSGCIIKIRMHIIYSAAWCSTADLNPRLNQRLMFMFL